MENIGIFYMSLKGRTEYVAHVINKKIKDSNLECDIFNIKENYKNIEKYKKIIFLTPTYGAGKLPSEWNDVLEYLKTKDIENIKFALCGCGNEGFYAATFVNGIRDLYDFLKSKNAKIIGYTDRNDYNYMKSRGEINGELVGLGIDIMLSKEEIDFKIDKWLKKII